jgi:cbb3-type cytochrome oxidase subunit 3
MGRRCTAHLRLAVTIALAICLLAVIPGVEGKKKKKSNKAAAAAEAAAGQSTAQSGGKTGGGAGAGGSTAGYVDEEDPKNQVATHA